MKNKNLHTCGRWLLAAALLAAHSASANLIHRYSFNEAPGATTVSDSVGGADGHIRMTTAAGGTPVWFDGTQAYLDGIAGYIDLPNGLVSAHTNITLEMWVTWTSGGTWCRVFDFGTNTLGEDPTGSGAVGNGGYYLFFTPVAGGTGLPRFTASDTMPGWERESPVLNSGTPLPFGGEAHLVITYGTDGARLFINGEQTAAGLVDIPLSTIQDVNVWLGRANYNDPMFGGSFNEFRVHNAPLTLPQILASRDAGPDTFTYDPGAPSDLTLAVNTSMVAGGSQVPQMMATYPGINFGVPFAIYGSDVTITSSAPNIISVGPLGSLVAGAPGTATVTVRLGALSRSATINVTPGVATLVHRYSFNEPNGSGTAADSVGGAAFDAFVMPPVGEASPVVISDGQARFPGGSYTTAGYIQLPGWMISQNRTNVSIEFWCTWNGGGAWQRVFDFGNSTKGPDPRLSGDGLGYLMFTPARGGGGARAEFRTEAPHVSVNNDGPASPGFPTGQETHVVVIAAPEVGLTRLYINGVPVASGGIPQYGAPASPWRLNQMFDMNNWLGVAQWNDPALNGSINEFRIHEGVLTDINVALSRAAGPDALPISNPGPLVSMSLHAPVLAVGSPGGAQAVLTGNFQNISGVDISGLTDVTYASANTNIFTVSARGFVTPRTNVGSADLIATYPGFSSTSVVHVLAPASLTLDVPANIYAGGANVTLQLLADFPGGGTNGLTNVNVSGYAGVTRASSATTVATITAAGVFAPLSPGSTTITSTYGGLTNETQVSVVTSPGHIPATIAHRYSFNEAPDSPQAKDSVGAAHGTVVNLSTGTPGVNNFDGSGQLVMVGAGNAQTPASAFVDLPNGLVSSRTSLTIEGWVTWNGPVGSSWQRILDFGMSSGLEDPPGSGNWAEDVVGNPGRAYMFVTPRSGANTYRFAIKEGTAAETPVLDGGAAFAVGVETHFAVVYDYPAGVVRLYRNGVRVGTAVATLPLSVVDDRNVWLGRAQWIDPMFNGSFNEFRIYDGVMFDADVAASFAAGPDNLPVASPTLTIALVGSDAVITWPTSAGAGFELERSAILGAGASWSGTGLPAPIVDGSSYKVTVPATNSYYYRLKD